jgi:signal transduction histidine kinase
MELEQEIVLALQTQRTSIAREWQSAARTFWSTRVRSEFGRGTEVYEAVNSTIITLENAFRSSNNGVTARQRTVSTSVVDSQYDRTAEKWASVPYAWTDVQKMLHLVGTCIDESLLSAGVDARAGGMCVIRMAALIELAASKRILKLEHELATIQEQAVLSQHLAGRFISSASHDLRTPLTAILGFTELLSEESYGVLTGEQANAVGHVYNSAQNLLEIVNNLLDIIQIQAGKLNLRCKRTEVAPVLTAVYGLLSSLAERRKVNFTIDVSNDLGAMNMDENIVRHIVYHLLSSALRSTPTGGTVSLSAERTPAQVTIITTDTALQLPREAIENMLGMVPLLENSPVRGYEGWEVGLALVRRYVELHEGSMEIENRAEQGTVFRVKLPAGIVSNKS